MGQCCGCPKPRPAIKDIQFTEFFQACMLNDVDVVRKLITDPDIRSRFEICLEAAVISGSIDVFDILLAQPDICVNKRALNIAIYENRPMANKPVERLAILNRLLAHPNIYVNEKDMYGRSHLMIAASVANCITVALLLAHPNIDVLAEDSDGNTALAYVTNEEIRNLILDKMPPVIAQDVFIMSVPPNTEDAISYETIERGMLMVDFHGEREFGRYYTKKTYDALSPKRNLMTRRPILKSDVVYYMADVPRS